VVTPSIQKDLALSDKQMGWCLGAFALAYSLFEMPGGFMGDRLGPRRGAAAHCSLVVVLHRRHRVRGESIPR